MTTHRWTRASFIQIPESENNTIKTLGQHTLLDNAGGEQFLVVEGETSRPVQISITNDEIVLFDPETGTVYGKAPRLSLDENPEEHSLETDVQNGKTATEDLVGTIEEVFDDIHKQTGTTLSELAAHMINVAEELKKTAQGIREGKGLFSEQMSTGQGAITESLSAVITALDKIESKTTLPQLEEDTKDEPTA